MSGTTRLRDPFDRETRVVAWKAPDGRQFMVCGTGDGYALRAPEDWESDTEIEFEADLDGNVFFAGEPLGWTVPREILRRANL